MNALPPAFFWRVLRALEQLGRLAKMSYNDYWYQQSLKRLYRWNVNVCLKYLFLTLPIHFGQEFI